MCPHRVHLGLGDRVVVVSTSTRSRPSVTGHTSQKTYFPLGSPASAPRLLRPFKISVIKKALIGPNRLKQKAFYPFPRCKPDPSQSFKPSRKVRPHQYIQRVTFSPSLSRAPPNCKTLQFLSILSDPHIVRDPLSGAVWAYGFAVIHFCKKFS